MGRWLGCSMGIPEYRAGEFLVRPGILAVFTSSYIQKCKFRPGVCGW